MKLSYYIYFLQCFDLYSYNLTEIEINMVQKTNAMTKYLARLITGRLFDRYHVNIAHRHADCICSFCQNLLNSVQLEKKDIKILLILKDGFSFNEYIYFWLNNHLKPRPSKVDQINLYEINTWNLDEYDLILTDYSNLNYIQSKYKVYKISDPIDEESDFLIEYMRISNNRNISLEQFAHYFTYLKVYRDCQIINTNDFLTQVDNDLDGLGNIPISRIRKLGRPINYYGANKTLIVPFLYKEEEKHENILMIYFNDPKMHLKYDTLIFFSVYSDFKLSNLAQIMNLCNEMNNNPELFKRLEKYLQSDVSNIKF